MQQLPHQLELVNLKLLLAMLAARRTVA